MTFVWACVRGRLAHTSMHAPDLLAQPLVQCINDSCKLRLRHLPSPTGTKYCSTVTGGAASGSAPGRRRPPCAGRPGAWGAWRLAPPSRRYWSAACSLSTACSRGPFWPRWAAYAAPSHRWLKAEDSRTPAAAQPTQRSRHHVRGLGWPRPAAAAAWRPPGTQEQCRQHAIHHAAWRAWLPATPGDRRRGTRARAGGHGGPQPPERSGHAAGSRRAAAAAAAGAAAATPAPA
jgi:hypothetical protein